MISIVSLILCGFDAWFALHGFHTVSAVSGFDAGFVLFFYCICLVCCLYTGFVLSVLFMMVLYCVVLCLVCIDLSHSVCGLDASGMVCTAGYRFRFFVCTEIQD